MRDLAWAVSMAGLAAASPHTSGARLAPSLLGGAVVGAGVWVFRRHGLAARAPWTTRGVEIRGAWLDWPGAVAALAALAVCLPALTWLWSQYTISIWRNGHGLFLPIIVFLMARAALREQPVELRPAPAWAAPWLALAVCLSWLGVNTRIGLLGALGVVTMVPGLCLLVLGRQATRRMAFPLALIVFMLPIPEGAMDPLGLTTVTAWLGGHAMQWLGMPVALDSIIITLPGPQEVGVSTNCSGISTLYAGVLAALVFGDRSPTWIRVTLVLSAWPLTVLFNSLRLVVLVAGTLRFGESFVHSPIHGLSGIATFWVVVISVGLLALALRRRDTGATP